MASLKAKVVLITGASSGIGAGAAIHLAGDGACLALVGRNVERLEDTAKQCIDKGLTEDQVLTIQADVCIESDVERIVKSTVERFGRLDVLVNNAAVAAPNFIDSESLMSDYDLIIRTNVRAVVQLTQLAVPHLLQTKGCIVNIISLNGKRAMPGIIASSLAKAAVDQFTKVLALELGPKGVRVNGIHPGCIMTPILKMYGCQSEEQLREDLKVFHPIGRIGEVSDIAHLVSFLASDAASFIHGESVCCDGGWNALCPR